MTSYVEIRLFFVAPDYDIMASVRLLDSCHQFQDIVSLSAC